MTLLQIKGRKHPTAAQEGASALHMLRTITLPSIFKITQLQFKIRTIRTIRNCCTDGIRNGPDLNTDALEDIIFNMQFWDPLMYAADFRWDEMGWNQLNESVWFGPYMFAVDAQKRRDGSVYIQRNLWLNHTTHAAGAAVDQSEPHTP
jgi:hypothetical protein